MFSFTQTINALTTPGHDIYSRFDMKTKERVGMVNAPVAFFWMCTFNRNRDIDLNEILSKALLYFIFLW